MSGYLQGYVDWEITNYCPNCGKPIHIWRSSGQSSCDIGDCDSCGMVFGVIELKESERKMEKE